MTDRKQDQAWVESQRKKYRDASTGAYVTREYAEANPETTVGESDDDFAGRVFAVLGANRGRLRAMTSAPDVLLDRIEALEADVALLIDTIKRMGE